MNTFKLIIQNLKYYIKEHLLLFLGLVLSTAILSAALIIGDSVKFSLNNIVEKRLGSTQQMILTEERFFPVSFAVKLSNTLKINAAAVLMINGMASSDNTEEKIPDIQVCGVENNFWKIANTSMPSLDENEVIINKVLAEKLKVSVKDEIFIRIQKVSFVTNNAPFVPTDNNSSAIRMKIKFIADENSFGNFDIRSNQITPFTVFLPLEKLSLLNFKGSYANMILIPNNDKSVEEINIAIKSCWDIEDINLNINKITSLNKLELRSDKIFIDDTVLNVLQKQQLQPQPHFSYLINYISFKNSSTPYSFVSALSHYPYSELKNDEIIINKWLAEDLGAKINDTISLRYFTIESFRNLQEKTNKFVVKQIIETNTIGIDSTLMPGFEGLTGVDKCSDWEAGIPVDYSQIRDKDEEWWKKYKGTPKAYIAYNTGVELWGENFGNSTGIRFDSETDTTKIKKAILDKLQPSNFGLIVHDIKNDASWSAANAVDFSQLFLGLSFFLILAAFLLSALLFSMILVQRRKEQGIYLSLGLPQNTVYKIFFIEGMINSVFSSFVGVFLGISFSKLILLLLNSIWFDIVRTSSILLFISPNSLFIGFISNIIISAIVIFFILKSHFKKNIRELNQQIEYNKKKNKITFRKLSFWIGLSTIILLILISAISLTYNKIQNSSIFFSIGLLILISLSSWFAFFLTKEKSLLPANINAKYLALTNLKFDYKRNTVITGILSIGIFIVVSIGAYRTDFNRNANSNSSGTGGYSFYIETNLGYNNDLSTSEGLEKSGISDTLQGLEFVQMLRKKNDDASCLNLNRIIQPSVLGVDTRKLIERNSFNFVSSKGKSRTWEMLDKSISNNCIPAVCDQSVLTWGLGKSLGDSIKYTNEKGETIYLVIVGGLENSLFQGNLIISEKEFIKHFPSISGSSIILADVSTEYGDQLNENLSEVFRNYGAKIEKAPERLAKFNSVTNTYLDIFLALGGIALILSTFGIGILLIKSINLREKHFAMMQAYGISIKKIRQMINIEFSIILICGIFIGLLAGVIANSQNLISYNADIPYKLLASIVLIFTINGLIWIFIASKMSIKKDFISNLRND